MPNKVPKKGQQKSVNGDENILPSVENTPPHSNASESPAKDTEAFPCPREDCGKIFKTKRTLYKHDRLIHRKDLPYKCSLCEKPFLDRRNCRLHEETHAKYFCRICKIQTNCPDGFLRHLVKDHEDRIGEMIQDGILLVVEEPEKNRAAGQKDTRSKDASVSSSSNPVISESHASASIFSSHNTHTTNGLDHYKASSQLPRGQKPPETLQNKHHQASQMGPNAVVDVNVPQLTIWERRRRTLQKRREIRETTFRASQQRIFEQTLPGAARAGTFQRSQIVAKPALPPRGRREFPKSHPSSHPTGISKNRHSGRPSGLFSQRPTSSRRFQIAPVSEFYHGEASFAAPRFPPYANGFYQENGREVAHGRRAEQPFASPFETFLAHATRSEAEQAFQNAAIEINHILDRALQNLIQELERVRKA